jgi:hypothetical protein
MHMFGLIEVVIQLVPSIYRILSPHCTPNRNLVISLVVQLTTKFLKKEFGLAKHKMAEITQTYLSRCFFGAARHLKRSPILNSRNQNASDHGTSSQHAADHPPLTPSDELRPPVRYTSHRQDIRTRVRNLTFTQMK